MALSMNQIEAVEACLANMADINASIMTELRNQFPGISFMRCDKEDMDVDPYRSGEKYQLYLVNRSQVCISLTDQPEMADGFVVTAK